MNLHHILDTLPAPVLTAAHWTPPSQSYIDGHKFALATYARPLQMELQDQIVSLHYSDILKFFHNSSANEDISSLVYESLVTMVTNSLLICEHPYLLIDHYFPKSLTTRDIPKRLMDTSGKFQILSDLLFQLANTGRVVNVCIIGLAGKMLDLIDALCMGHRCNIIRHKGIKLRDSSANKKNTDTNINVNVHIIGSDFETNSEIESSNLNLNCIFDFVVNMDTMTKFENDWLTKRTTVEDTFVIDLITANSAEHICRHFLKDNISVDNLYPNLNEIVAAIVVLREKVGHIPSGLKPAYAGQLDYLSPYLTNPKVVQWSLPDMAPIRKYTSDDVERSLLREVKFSFNTISPASKDDGKVNNTGAEESQTFFDGGYYLEKRLEKKYLTNPLLGGYAHLTGISREVSSGEVLTHTLLFDYGATVDQLGKMNCDVKAFEEFNSIRVRNWEENSAEYKKFEALVSEKESKLKEIETKLSELETASYVTQEEINMIKQKFDNLSKQEVVKELISKEETLNALLLDVTKSNSKLEATQNESKYMNEEILRAEKSINDSTTEILKFKEKNVDLQSKIDKLVHEAHEIAFHPETSNALLAAEEKNAQLKAKISKLLDDINNPNIRQRTAATRNFKK